MESCRRSRTDSLPERRNTFLSARVCIALVVVLANGLAQFARGDEFERLEGASFFDLIQRSDARAHGALTSRQVEALPVVLRSERAAFLIVRTDEGHLAKMLISFGFRKQNASRKQGSLVPVMLLERFWTLNAGDRVSIKARGKDVVLYDDFRYDLDSGQVVPDELGGDILFATGGAEGPRLVALGAARIYTLTEPLPVSTGAAGQPSSGQAVLPGDFAGRYRLLANGQWSGGLELTVGDGTVTGRFRSDRNGAVYPVTGSIAAANPGKITFTIQFPRAQQTFEGLLWSDGKNAFAGTMVMLERPFSFVAVREGAALEPEAIGLALGGTPATAVRPKIVNLEAAADRYLYEGGARTPSELAVALSRAVKADAATNVILVVPGALPFDRVLRAVQLVQNAGVKAIGFAPASDRGPGD
jgi:hypothetical protein